MTDNRPLITGDRTSRFLAWAVALLIAAAAVNAQTKPTAVKRPTKPAAKAPAAKAAPPPKPIRSVAETTCPSPLGVGVSTRLPYCDVIVSRYPADGIIVRIPPHRGTATLSFDLHNRHTFSADQIRAGRGFAGYTATMGVLTMGGALLTRGVVRSEFRTARDLHERIGGGAGPGGVKAVAPSGAEPIVVDIPEDVTEVSLLGEKLSVIRYERTETFTAAGRPIAIVSNVIVEYLPLPPKAPPKKATASVKKKDG